MKEPLVFESSGELDVHRQTTLITVQDREFSLPVPVPNAYPLNEISTCKYNCVTFLPKNLYEQFHKLANVYFLAAAVLQCLPDISNSGGVPSILLPLLFVLIISGLKDLLEDIKRRKSDQEENSRLVLRRRNNGWEETTWKDLRIGDIVKVNNDKSFPADLILLSSSDEGGIAYVETKNLDGETNLKHKQANKTTQALFLNETNLDCFKPRVKCQGPNNLIYEFSGLIYMETDIPCILDYGQILLRGSGLRNTDWVIGLCAYTGHDTKIMLNSPKPRVKYSKVEQQMNHQIVLIFLLQTLICLIASVFNLVWFWETETETDQYLNLSATTDDLVTIFIISFFSWMLIFSNFVPISLIVTLEMVKFLQAIFIAWDMDLYWEETKRPAVVQSSNLNEELGQVNYVFSDKTGTLTQNVMEFRKLSVKGVAYGTDQRMDHSEKRPHVDFCDPFFMKKQTSEDVIDFMVFLATCHTLIAEQKHEEEIEYKASSPDELALVHGAAYFGVKFLGRDKDQNVLLDVHSERMVIRILNIIEFTSDRKRMTIIAQYPNDQIKVLCKGADSVLLPRCRNCAYTQSTVTQLEEFASQGLRTLVYSYKNLTSEDYKLWNREYLSVMTDLNGRDARIAQLSEKLETDLNLLGASAIEDKLQAFVPETIAKLREAGIKVWVLTGDKVETAVNIGYACALLTRDMGMLTVDGRRTIEVERQIAAAERAFLQEPNTQFALIVTGESLLKALNPRLAKSFVAMADKCSAVLACRVSPQQKADVVSLVISTSPNVRSLSIGDGANDVSMITSAHVGVGIAGKEGQQAVRASDYAIGQFSFLLKLLFVHGRECYRRNATLICFNFYKNVLLVMPLFWYGYFSVFSGQGVYNTWIAQLFNVLYASLPIMLFALFDKEFENTELLSTPKHYHVGMLDQLFRNSIFWLWIFEAILQSLYLTLLVFYALCYYTGDRTGGTQENLWVASVELYGLIVIFANIRVLMFSCIHYWFTLGIIILSIYIYYLTSVFVIEWLPLSDFLDNWDMRGSNVRIFTNPNAYTCAVLSIVGGFMMYPMGRAVLELWTPATTKKSIKTDITSISRRQSTYASFRKHLHRHRLRIQSRAWTRATDH